MALSREKYKQVKWVTKHFVEQKRPPENIRDEVDVSYRIEDQSVIIFEIRPLREDRRIKLECNIAKATYVKSRDIWKIYWQKRDQKWHTYGPEPEVSNINEFFEIVDKDECGCFWG